MDDWKSRDPYTSHIEWQEYNLFYKSWILIGDPKDMSLFNGCYFEYRCNDSNRRKQNVVNTAIIYIKKLIM